MRKTNILFILWGVIVVGIFICLTILGFMLKKMDRDYKGLEDKIKESVIRYAEDKSISLENLNEIKVTKQELIDNNLLDELTIKDDICDGYVIIKFQEGYTYEPFIKCRKYTTEGYYK